MDSDHSRYRFCRIVASTPPPLAARLLPCRMSGSSVGENCNLDAAQRGLLVQLARADALAARGGGGARPRGRSEQSVNGRIHTEQGFLGEERWELPAGRDVPTSVPWSGVAQAERHQAMLKLPPVEKATS